MSHIGRVSMPRARSPDAPQFEGNEHLDSYLNELEYCFKEANVQDDEERISQAFRYLKTKTRDVWRSVLRRLTVPTTSTKWIAFKAALYDEYPESDPRERMRLRDLESLVTETSRQQSFSKANFEDYSREFNTLADFLIAQGVYDESEAKRAYVQGLPSSLRDPLMQYLSLVCMDQSPHHGYDRNLVRRMTRHWFETRAVLNPLPSLPFSTHLNSSLSRAYKLWLPHSLGLFLLH